MFGLYNPLEILPEPFRPLSTRGPRWQRKGSEKSAATGATRRRAAAAARAARAAAGGAAAVLHVGCDGLAGGDDGFAADDDEMAYDMGDVFAGDDDELAALAHGGDAALAALARERAAAQAFAHWGSVPLPAQLRRNSVAGGGRCVLQGWQEHSG